MISREPLVLGKKSLKDVTEDICGLVEKFPPRRFYVLFTAAVCLFIFYIFIQSMIVAYGMGMMGISYPNMWGTDIVTFVFWIGIGHAGTLISAILFLFRQKWRTGIARTAEAMTVFAVMTAGVFPILHTGRPWLAYWLLPYPNQRGPLWVNFRSPLIWDVFAVSTYATVSIVFWYVGLIPDLATIRDRARNIWRKRIYGALSMGWRGTARNWNHYEMTYMLLAGLSTPLVLSVHSIVSFDFSVSQLPGWHATIFPPYFVAGAIFSGFGMVVTIMCLLRAVIPGFKDYVTMHHMENMCKIIMLTSLLVGYAYLSEFFFAWYSGDAVERFIFVNRIIGPYWWAWGFMIGCNVLIPQMLWFKYIRTNIIAMFIISICINIGMWYERFIIDIGSLHHDFMPSAWHIWHPTFYDWGAIFGSFGMFLTIFLLYTRLLPTISIAETKPIISVGHEAEEQHG